MQCIDVDPRHDVPRRAISHLLLWGQFRLNHASSAAVPVCTFRYLNSNTDAYRIFDTKEDKSRRKD
jgi:hypothetical protein